MSQTSRHIIEKGLTRILTEFIDPYFLFYFSRLSQFKLNIAFIHSFNGFIFFLNF